jgi:hypothetical protein
LTDKHRKAFQEAFDLLVAKEMSPSYLSIKTKVKQADGKTFVPPGEPCPMKWINLIALWKLVSLSTATQSSFLIKNARQMKQ